MSNAVCTKCSSKPAKQDHILPTWVADELQRIIEERIVLSPLSRITSFPPLFNELEGAIRKGGYKEF